MLQAFPGSTQHTVSNISSMPIDLLQPVSKPLLFSPRANVKAELKSDLEVTVYLKALLEKDVSVTSNKKPIAIDSKPLTDYQSFIAKYTPAEHETLQKQLAAQIMDPAMSQTARQAEVRCILALFYLEQGRADKARAQLKSAAKTPGFTLPEDFSRLHQELMHPRKAPVVG